MASSSIRNALLLSLLIAPLSRSEAQATPPAPLSRLLSHSDKGFSNAANRWQLGAIVLAPTNDPVGPALRASRTSYWSSAFNESAQFYGGVDVGEPSPLGGSFLSTTPELPAQAGSVWVLASFNGYHVFPTDNTHKRLYTEIDFKVISVVRTPKGVSLTPAETLNVDIIGGRAKDEGGVIVTSRLAPRSHFVQPGKTYLLQLNYQSVGQFFTLARWWDASSGTIEPDQEAEIYRESHQHSVLSGKSVADALAYLDASLPISK